MTRKLSIAAVMGLLILPAAAQDDGGLYAPSVWDLTIGDHAVDLPTEQFINFACGTNGGPPSLPLTGWTDFARCPAEAGTGLHEVFFRYDNEIELWAKAHDLLTQAATYQYTSVYSIPVIASALFDDNGFMVMLRLVTDPAVEVEIRERAITLGGFLTARFGVDGWSCADLPRLPGEEPHSGRYEKRECRLTTADGFDIYMLTEHFNRPGQLAINPVDNTATEGQFWSSTRLEMRLTNGIEDAEARLAEIAARPDPGPTERDLLAERAMNCPGCDLSGVNLKRANLTGANLAGANLTGANLHEVILNDANLEGAILVEANLNGGEFRRANLAGANLSGSMMYQAAFDGANLAGADMTEALAGFASLARTNLSDATMISMDLRNVRMNDSDLRGADLRLSWAEAAVLTRSDLTGALLSDTVLPYIVLINAKLNGVDFRGADLIGANMRGVDLSGADLSFARLTFATLADITAVGTVWENAALPGGFVPPR